GDELGVRHARGRHVETGRAAHRHVARHAGREAERAHLLRGRDELVAQTHRHDACPNSAASAPGSAIPRSVMKLVTSRLGVISKAGLATALSEAMTCTRPPSPVM